MSKVNDLERQLIKIKDELSQTQEKLNSTIEELDQTKAKFEKNKADAEFALEEAENLINSLNTEIDGLMKDLSEANVKISELEEKLKSKEEEFNSLLAKFKNKTAHIEEIEALTLPEVGVSSDMSFTMVRACHRCRCYVMIDPANPNNQRLIKIFESNHEGHTIVSVSISEVKDYYENVEKKININKNDF